MSKAVQTGVKLPAELDELAMKVRTEQLRQKTAAGEWEDGLIAHMKQFYPDLLPLLAARAATPVLPAPKGDGDG